MRRHIVSLSMLVLVLLSALRLEAQQPACSTPYFTEERVKEHLLALAELSDRGEAQARISGFVASRVIGRGCSIVAEDVNVEELVGDLIRFVALQEDRDLKWAFFQGVSEGLLAADELGLTIPLDDLIFGVESGPDNWTRSHVLRTMLELSNSAPGVRAYLVRQARAPSGPPAWPELPVAIVRMAYPAYTDRGAALRGELESQPAAIRNAEARCLVERGGPSHGVPGRPSCSDR